MRFITYRDGSGTGIGLRDGENYRGLSCASVGGFLKDFIGSAEDLHGLAEKLREAPVLDRSAIILLPPIQKPPKILCIGLNYADHSAESGFEVPEYPTVFARFANSLVGADEPIIRPSASNMLDYECELVIVIGKGGRHIAEDAALDHVAGYSIFNDGSIRDFQIRTPQWTMGKVFDRTGAFGPELVTPEELPAGCEGLQIRTILNGEVLQDANTADLIFPVAKLVSILSEAMTLEPGDLIVSGTPGGVGGLRDPQIWMKPGDECTIEIEQIGSLTSTIAQEGES